LPLRIAAEKEELTLQHNRELLAQRNEAAKLKDQLIQARLQHVRALKEAIAAGDAKVEEARKQFADAEGQLRAELEEETKLLNLEQEKTTELSVWQATISQMIRDTDAKAPSRCFCSFAYKLSFLTGLCLYQILMFPQGCSRTLRIARH
jgi:molecular chaperone DnaK (HSP70)